MFKMMDAMITEMMRSTDERVVAVTRECFRQQNLMEKQDRELATVHEKVKEQQEIINKLCERLAKLEKKEESREEATEDGHCVTCTTTPPRLHPNTDSNGHPRTPTRRSVDSSVQTVPFGSLNAKLAVTMPVGSIGALYMTPYTPPRTPQKIQRVKFEGGDDKVDIWVRLWNQFTMTGIW